MELLALLAILMVFSMLAIAFGNDSRPQDDTRPWWPGVRNDFPQHHI